MLSSIIVCVEFDDFLAITLPRNVRHFERTLVITSPSDERTKTLVLATPKCELLETDAFYRNGSSFNKGLAMEEGFDVLGRDGWICIWDADIVMPESVEFAKSCRCLYVPIRRILPNPKDFSDCLEWSNLSSPTQAKEFAGYFQLFHASAVIPPWYTSNWIHAGGCDSDFQLRFPPDQLRRPPFEVLHLGLEGVANSEQRIGINWCGRVSPRIDDGSTCDRAGVKTARIWQLVKDRLRYGTTKEKL